MPLQTGPWRINSNGALGWLTINQVDTSGNVDGTCTLPSTPFPANTVFAGLWDEMAAKLTFFVGTNAAGFVAYTGFLAADQFRMPQIAGSVVSTLAGYYEDFTNAGATDRRIFGWYAQLAEA